MTDTQRITNVNLHVPQTNHRLISEELWDKLIVGHRVGAAEDAYQSAMGLAYVALQLATRCRYLTYPRHAEADR